jgi:hypothetical protein
MRTLCLALFVTLAFESGCKGKLDGGTDPVPSGRTVTVPVGATSAVGFGAATPVATTGPAPEIPDESTQKLQDAVSSAKGALKRCYEDALNETPYLSVEVEVSLHVDGKGHGSVKKIDGFLPDGMKRCVTNTLTGIAYPPNHETDMNIPLSFKSTTL